MEPASHRNGSHSYGSSNSADSQSRDPAPTGDTISHEDDDVHETVDADEAQKQREFLRAIVESQTCIQLVGVLRTYVEGHPQKAQLNHTLRMKIQADNAAFYASNRKYFLIGLGMCLLFLGVVIWSLHDEKGLLLPVLTAVVSLLAGAGGGFIFGQARRTTNSDS